ncbi:MAG TPA: hypothetical protein VK970_08905 [Candidatus Methylacidiphilales bacterium]|nr:hypothetical protein [Candidatus Methylacidiphilales bacterium]
MRPLLSRIFSACRIAIAPALMLSIATSSIHAAGADAPSKVDYQGNLSRIPAKDPEVKGAPALLPSVTGKHPRLLFTAEEIEQLKKATQSDPLLKEVYEATAASAKRARPGKERPLPIFLTDTPALAQSNGSTVSMAYAYAINKDPDTLANIKEWLKVMLEQEYWADTLELDSSMGAACNMLLAGALFDAAYNELEPELRSKFAAKLLIHARRLHYLGHKKLALISNKYWQQDPQPNHRWYRARGLAACVLSISDEPGLDTAYLRQELKNEMDFLIKWYPHDGDCHEGAGYQVFGFRSLADAAGMMDRCLGTSYLKAPGFSNAWAQQLYYWLPGRGSNMGFGDDMNSSRPFGYDDAAFFISPHLSRDKNVQAALMRRYKMMAVRKDGRPYVAPWSLMAYYDPTVGEGDYKALPLHRLFADLGAATMRDSWEADTVMFAFKCGPYGGFGLNHYRQTFNADGKPQYINVAHDDPDANSFALGKGADFFFHPGFYSFRKLTSLNNTLIVNGKGQRNEGSDYTQPVANVDMRALSYLTGWKPGANGRVIIEGETGASYTGLTRFRRSAVWMPGEYLLLLDDVRAGEQQNITWLAAAERAKFVNPEEGLCYSYTKSGARMDFQILANKPLDGAIDYCFMDGRFGSALIHQFQFTAKADTVKYACLIDPWQKKPRLTFTEAGDVMTLTVKSESFTDTWTWTPAKDDKTPSMLECKRAGVTLISLTDKDKAPLGD